MFHQDLTAEEIEQLTKTGGASPLILGRYEIEIPGNGIDQHGIDLIQGKLCEWGFALIPEIIPRPAGEETIWLWDWKVGGKGEYVGTLPKRISKLIWQARGKKLTPEQLSEIGNIGSAHSGGHCKYWFDVVNHIDWGQSDFGQPNDCCYWGCHASAKEMILENGGGAIRFFADDSYRVEKGYARVWLAPWNNCWIVFNGYGLGTLATARILAAHLGHVYYRYVQLTNQGKGQGELWINNGGYLVGPQESVLQWSKIDLEWEEPSSLHCENCECRIHEEDHYHSPDGRDRCEECYDEHFFYCESCNEDCWLSNSHLNPHGNILCQSCWEEDYFECKACGENTPYNEGTQSPLDCRDYYCEECYCNRYAHCDDCGDDFKIDDMVIREDGHYCEECAVEHEKKEDLCPAP